MRKQVAIRLEEEFLKQLKIMLINEGMTLQDYIENLINKDMEDRKNGK